MRIVAVALIGLFVTASCTDEASRVTTKSAQEAEWRELPKSPLSPRESAVVVATDGRILVIGGSDADPCPPNADCVTPTEPALRDGAAFDTKTRTWTRLPDAPTGVLYAHTARLGGSTYFLMNSNPRPGTKRTLLELRNDMWTEHDLPPGEFAVAATDDELVLYPQTHENGQRPDLAFDPSTDEAYELPRDPLAPSYDRFMTWTGEDLVLTAKDDVDQPGSAKPSLVRAASFDGTKWSAFRDSESIGSLPWFYVDGRLVHPALGSADGGDVNGWGRSYAEGGMLDPKTGEWSDLPNAPDEPRRSAFSDFVGGERFVACCGWVFDVADGRWTQLAPFDRGALYNAGSAFAGDELIVWGGSADMELLDDGWSLRLP